jgi:hypothetical protein
VVESDKWSVPLEHFHVAAVPADAPLPIQDPAPRVAALIVIGAGSQIPALFGKPLAHLCSPVN